MSTTIAPAHVDAEADVVMQKCLNLAAPQSFFLYAGAGSGKTRSLVAAVQAVCQQHGRRLNLSGRRIGIITYTNAACDEVRGRLEYDSRVEVSTIHAFAWALVGGFDADIRKWLSVAIRQEIEELEDLQSRSRGRSKAYVDRERAIEAKRRRYGALDDVKRFVYSPTGDNRTRGSLNHAEVIAMTAELLVAKPTLASLLVARYPILLVDESQDTSRRLMEALLTVAEAHEGRFALGLIGDMMQRIYADGKADLFDAIPASWARPAKRVNHRSPERIIKLINKIRGEADTHEQVGRNDRGKGYARLFLFPAGKVDMVAAEAGVLGRMASITADDAWLAGAREVKKLTLEHHMAARRVGFADLFEALYSVERLRTGLLDGSLPGIEFFVRNVLPLVKSLRAGDKFGAASVMRARSPLFERGRLQAAGGDQLTLVRRARKGCEDLEALWANGACPTLNEVLQNVYESGLFELPDGLRPFVGSSDDAESGVADEEVATELAGWRRALDVRWTQLEHYAAYVRGDSEFGTHQGVKGLEFPRVLVIVSDDEARGFSFSYEKLFGVKPKSKADLENEAASKETTLDRTRRLLYVTCSRAEKSLAVVYYSSDPDAVRAAAIDRGWFEPDEVEVPS